MDNHRDYKLYLITALFLLIGILSSACSGTLELGVEDQTPTPPIFGNVATLTDFEVDPARQILKLTWKITTEEAESYTVFIHWIDSQGKLAAQIDRPLSTGRAVPGQTTVEEYGWGDLSLPAGIYSLQIGIYTANTRERLPVDNEKERAVTLTEIEIEPAESPTPVEAVQPIDETRPPGVGTRLPLSPAGVAIIGTVMDVSPSARLIILQEPVEGFSVVALTEESKLLSHDGDEITLQNIGPGVRIEASGTPGDSTALLASRVRLLP